MLNISATIKSFFLDLFETDQQEKENFLRISFGIVSTVIILILINFVVLSIYPDSTEAIMMHAKELIHPFHHDAWIWPEPIERMQTFITLIFIPILIYVNIKIFSSKLFSRILISNSMYFANVALWFSFLAILFYLAFKFDDPNFIWREYWSIYKIWLHQEIRIIFKTMTGELRFLVTLIIFPIITYFIFNGVPKKYNKSLNWTLYSLILFFLLSMFLLSICNRDNYISVLDNLNTVLYPISQVQQGRGLLADFTTQYGLYSHFLYPLFKLINVNVVSFSITMSALTVISYSLIFVALRKIISNKLVVFFSFFAIIYFSYFLHLFSGSFDLRYAFNPIRMLFPALILFSVFTYILNPKKFLYLLIIFLSSLSILWNFETGVICFLSFYIYVLYEKLADTNLRSYIAEFIKHHSIISASILILTFLLFSIVIYLQSNSFPNWNLLVKYLAIYSISSFSSMPMPVFHAWNLVFLVYLYGIYIGLNSILTNKKNVLDSVAFFLAIFGFGISSYFLNRSHDFNLIPVLYPCFILLAIYLSKLLAHSRRENLFRIKNFLSVSVISFVLVTIFVQMMQPTKIINSLTHRIPDILSNRLTNEFHNNGVALIKYNVKPNDIVAILADEDSLMYLETQTSSPFNIPGSTELVLKTDWDKLKYSLLNNKSYKVFLSGTYLKSGEIPDSRYYPIMRIIDDHYYLDDWFGNWRMFVPKEYRPVSDIGVKATATYTEFCPNNCKDVVNNFIPIENFPTNTKYVKFDFDLSEPITLNSIMIHVINNSQYDGTLSTLNLNELTNIGILDSKNKQFINTESRTDKLNYKVKNSFSVLIPEASININACEPAIIELIYNDNKKIKFRAYCE